MTQGELARVVRMPQPSIARIERGTVLPRTATLLAILEATGQELAIEPRGPAADREAIRRRLALDVPDRTRAALGKPARDIRTSPTRILRRLRRFGVPFVLIGELAEAARGAPINVGRVIEVCHARTDEASERLATTLKDLEESPSLGRLILQTETGAGDDYEVLRRNAARMLVDTALLVQVPAVEDLVRIRRANGSDDDRAAIAVLRAIDES
jgi:transcriptional regulator with XRE-family HTH domain